MSKEIHNLSPSNKKTITIQQTFRKDQFLGLSQYMVDNGMTSEQDVVRFAVAKFLEANQYPRPINNVYQSK